MLSLLFENNIDTERSDQITAEEWGETVGGGCPGNSKQHRTGLAEMLNAHGIMGQKM